MKNNLFYKGIFEKPYWTSKNPSNPIIEHNIPNNYIINYTDLKTSVVSSKGYISHRYLYVTDECFNNIIKDKLIYPTEIGGPRYSSGRYFGAIIVRNEANHDVLTYVTQHEFGETGKLKGYYILTPMEYFRNGGQDYSTGSIPKRKIKCFFTEEEYNTDKKEKKAKSDNKWNKELEDKKALYEKVPEVIMATPKFKIVNIIKETDKLPAKVGDIIHATMNVITIDETGRARINMQGSSSACTNWFKGYINDEYIKLISPLDFEKLFFNNYQVVQI